MVQVSSCVCVGKGPDFVMTRGEIEINHQAVLKVYRMEEGSPVLVDSDAPFDRSLALVIEKLKQKLVAYGWNEDSYATGSGNSSFPITIVTSNVIFSLIYKLVPKLTEKQVKELTDQFKRGFKVDLR